MIHWKSESSTSELNDEQGIESTLYHFLLAALAEPRLGSVHMSTSYSLIGNSRMILLVYVVVVN